MKIVIPETPQELQSQRLPDGTTADFSFARFVTWLVDSDTNFTRDSAGLRSGRRVTSAVDSASVGDECELEAPDWRLLCDSAKAPSQGYPVRPPRLALPYIDAIEAAKGE